MSDLASRAQYFHRMLNVQILKIQLWAFVYHRSLRVENKLENLEHFQALDGILELFPDSSSKMKFTWKFPSEVISLSRLTCYIF